MMKNAWRNLAVIGVVTSFVVVGGCVVGSSDDNTGGAAGSSSGGGGTGATGGSGGTGATGATGGTGATGATGGAAGSGGAAFVCEPLDGGSLGSTPGDCKASDATDACQVCVEQKCCTEWEVCAGTNPGNQCFWGGPDGNGEIFCLQTCVKTETGNGKTPEEALGMCGQSCATPSCSSTIGGATNDLGGCLNTNCFAECLQ